MSGVDSIIWRDKSDRWRLIALLSLFKWERLDTEVLREVANVIARARGN